MELTLPPVIPTTRVVNGHNVFNKGYHHGIRGKTYEEYYGEETGRAKRENMRRKMKGHPFWSNADAAAKSVVAIYEGKVVARFTSAKKASDCMGLNYATIRKYIKGRAKPRNGWKWFYEKDGTWFEHLKEF